MAEVITELPSGKFRCRRCGGHNFLQWHKERTDTGVNATELKCNDCEEYYKIRWRQDCPEHSIICQRKTLCIDSNGHRYMEHWTGANPQESANLHLPDGRWRVIRDELARQGKPRH